MAMVNQKIAELPAVMKCAACGYGVNQRAPDGHTERVFFMGCEIDVFHKDGGRPFVKLEPALAATPRAKKYTVSLYACPQCGTVRMEVDG
jgi:Zn finger protein HypA/HybF involved in hydrogenase expression